MRVKNALGELVEVGSDAFGLIGCSLGGSSLLELLTLSKDTRKQRRAMLALVSHFKSSFRAPFTILGSSSHVYLVFEEVTSGSEWGVLLRSPTHSNASSPMHDGKFLFKNM